MVTESERRTAALVVALLSFPLFSAPLLAAEGEIEEVVVTGSFIKRTSQVDSVSPITNVGRADIDQTGIITGQELFRWLPSNTGSENQADALTQGGTPGTANVNLRGLGLGSTLVLINGRRQTVSSATANGGDTFVDINSLMPLIMLENIEVLKDGAAAIFGSDAVAGVVNYKTRDNFEGFEMRFNYQATGEDDDQRDQEISAIWGVGNDTSSLVFAASYFDRTEMTLGERDFDTKTNSTFGQPGSYLPLAPSALVPSAVPGAFNADPGCAGATGATVLPTGGGTSLCLFDFGPSFSLVPDEQRLSAYVVGEHFVSEALTLRGELGVARNEAVGGYSPSFPNLSFPLIGADHPGNPYGVPVLGRFRIIGDGLGAPGSGRVVNTGDHQTTRFVLNASGDMGFRNWSYDASWSWSQNDYTATAKDQVLSKLNLGVQGFGGPRCNPLTGTAGVGDCEYLNPFASGFTPGSGVENSPELLDWATSDNQSETKSELSTLDLIFSGDVADLPAGALGLAFGYQRREESRVANLSDDANNADLAFLIGDLDTNAEREVDAFFVEALVPIFDNDSGSLEAQLAVRHEDYSTGFDSTDPKVGLLYRTQSGRFAARATYGTAFRAPTLFQQFVQDTSLNQTSDPLTSPNPTFLGWTASPAELDPEEADTFNVGVTFEPIEDLTISVDYYNVQYENRLVQQSGQELLNAENAAINAAGCTTGAEFLASATCQAAANPTQILRDPTTGVPLRIFVDRFNAANAETDGIDLEVGYVRDTDIGSFFVNHSTSYVLSFDLDAGGMGAVSRDGAGSRNNASALANPIPQIRSNTVVGWGRGSHNVNAVVRLIDSYDDQAPDGSVAGEIDEWWVVDLQYGFTTSLFDDHELGITLGMLNAFDEDPPEVSGSANEFGYDTKTHDPRGRMFYMQFNYAL